MEYLAHAASAKRAPIAERVLFNRYRWTGDFALSDTGLLVYESGSAVPVSQLTWFDLEGHKLGTLAEPAAFSGVFLSPDDRQLVAPTMDSSSGQYSLWMYDIARGIRSRFTFGAMDFDAPVWSPDGKRVAFNDASGNVLMKPSDSSSEAKVLLADAGFNTPMRWSPDGSTLLYCVQTSQGMGIWALPLSAEPKPKPFIVTDANEGNGAFSPDGKWFAYTSDETGRNELYVVPFPHLGAKRQLSTDGADYPNWFDSGRQLAYVIAERKLIVLDVKSAAEGLDVGKPRVAFGGQALPGIPRYDVDGPVCITRDGKRVLLPVPVGGSSTAALTLVNNWTAELRK